MIKLNDDELSKVIGGKINPAKCIFDTAGGMLSGAAAGSRFGWIGIIGGAVAAGAYNAWNSCK